MTLQALGLFCEDIRDEKTGQVTIVGILTDNIQLPPPPDDKKHLTTAIVPKLGLYIRVQLPMQGTPKGPMSVALIMPDSTSLPLGEIGSDVIEKAHIQATASQLPYAGVVFHAVMQGFQVATAGLITAVIDNKGERTVCALLNVRPPTST